jgi:probable F420-dependent oxidoreductase
MTARLADTLGRFGIWRATAQVTPELAADLERLGYGALWLGGSPAADLTIVDQLLAATSTIAVGTSIVNMWQSDPDTVARSYARIESGYPGRFVLGVGAGHREATPEYASPYDTLVTYVDRLLAADVPAGRLVLAALGPRLLTLAAERTAGAIPYLVPPEHTRRAREILGPDKLLAPEHKAVVDADPQRGRVLGSRRVRTPYLGLVNYTSNLRRLGYTDADLAGSGSDRLIDELVAHGSAEQVAARLTAHLDAGADHVCIQLLTEADAEPLPQYADLARALGLQQPAAR